MVHLSRATYWGRRHGGRIAALLLALLGVSGCAALSNPVQGLAAPPIPPTSRAQLPVLAYSAVARPPTQVTAIGQHIRPPTSSAVVRPPTQVTPTPIATVTARLSASLPFNIIIADRGNNRIIEVTPDKQIVWSYHFNKLRLGRGADDAFFTPGNQTIIANLEENQTIVEIDYATKQIIWQYGISGQRGAGPNQLNEPDDAYRLTDGTTSVADIKNCRILFVSAAKRIIKQYGHTRRCSSAAGYLNKPNGDTPLPNGHMLITEIRSSRISEVDATGAVLWQFHAPLHYPSDAQLTPRGTIILADYSNPGAILELATDGTVLWTYRFPKGSAQALNHPSLAAELPNGNIIANDDFNHRVIVIDKTTKQIVWQYGVTSRPGHGDNELNIPDGLDWRH